MRLRNRRRRALAPVALVVAWLAGSCGPSSVDGEPVEDVLQTEEVGGPVDENLSTEDDRRGPRWVESESASLPTDLPAEFPVPGGAAVVEVGTEADGRNLVVLATTASPDEAESLLVGKLASAGWATEGSNDGYRAERAGRTVWISFSPADPGTYIRVRYR